MTGERKRECVAACWQPALVGLDLGKIAESMRAELCKARITRRVSWYFVPEAPSCHAEWGTTIDVPHDMARHRRSMYHQGWHDLEVAFNFRTCKFTADSILPLPPLFSSFFFARTGLVAKPYIRPETMKVRIFRSAAAAILLRESDQRSGVEC